jgi:hypothetical protein
MPPISGRPAHACITYANACQFETHISLYICLEANEDSSWRANGRPVWCGQAPWPVSYRSQRGLGGRVNASL